MQERHAVQPTFRRFLTAKLRRLADSNKIVKVNLPSLKLDYSYFFLFSFHLSEAYVFPFIIRLDMQSVVYPMDLAEILHVLN